MRICISGLALFSALVIASPAGATRLAGEFMALGAGAFDVIRMILGECWLLIGFGVAAGIAAALVAGRSRWVSQVLFGITPTDVTTLVGATVLIAAVATIAGFLPARRAARVDPLVALGHE